MPEDRPLGMHLGMPLGMVVSGSLSKGVEVRLGPSISVEDLKVGTFVTLQGDRLRFFGVLTEIALGSSDPRLKDLLPDVQNPFVAQVMAGTAAYGTITVLPSLTMPMALGDSAGPAPARTVPAHFSQAYAASERDRGDSVRQRGRAPLLDRQSSGHGDQGLPRPEGTVRAVHGRLRQERHRQDLPHQAAPHRHSPEQRGLHPGL